MSKTTADKMFSVMLLAARRVCMVGSLSLSPNDLLNRINNGQKLTIYDFSMEVFLTVRVSCRLAYLPLGVR
jgi:hypothetical protein